MPCRMSVSMGRLHAGLFAPLMKFGRCPWSGGEPKLVQVPSERRAHQPSSDHYRHADCVVVEKQHKDCSDG